MEQADVRKERIEVMEVKKTITGDDLSEEHCRMVLPEKNNPEDRHCASVGKGISFHSLPAACKEYIDGVCFEMVFVPGGEFGMGSNAFCSDEKPVHQEIIKSFWFCKTEVTMRQFKLFIDKTGYVTDAEKGDGSYSWTDNGWSKQENVSWRCDERGKLRGDKDLDYPVVHISWNDAMAFCKWLSGITGKIWRLPTEPEWEYAAGGGHACREIWAGTDDEKALGRFAWYRSNSAERIHKVAKKDPNKLGLLDMSGNVCELCSEWYGHYEGNELFDPSGPSSETDRAVRGGSWLYDSCYCRASFRDFCTPVHRDGNLGFRMVMDL